jgi:hypothetical protein
VRGLFDALGREIFILREVHCDPHPGNFAFRTDGSIVMYDFGAVKRIPEDDTRALRDLTLAAYQGDYDALDQLLVNLDVRKDDGPSVSGDFYRPWVEMLLPPFGMSRLISPAHDCILIWSNTHAPCHGNIWSLSSHLHAHC